MEASAAKPAYVSIRPAFRPLLPKPCAHALESCGDDDRLAKKKKLKGEENTTVQLLFRNGHDRLKARKHKKPKANSSALAPPPSTVAPANLVTKRKKSQQPQDYSSLLTTPLSASLSAHSQVPRDICDIALRQTTQSSTVMLSCDHDVGPSRASPNPCDTWMSMDINLPIRSLDPEDPREPFSPSLSSHSDAADAGSLITPTSPGPSVSPVLKPSSWPGLVDSEFETSPDPQVSKHSESSLDYLFPLDSYLSPASLTDLYLD